MVAHSVCVRNATRGTVLATRATIAASPWARARGLLGRRDLPPGDGLVIRPCNSVHTFFMAFPIDVVYVGRENEVLAITPAMRPQRVGPIVWRARDVIELPAGTVQATATTVGDRLTLEAVTGAPSAVGDGPEPATRSDTYIGAATNDRA
jgi:uncharacterized membrane protein (UPF0127 family)